MAGIFESDDHVFVAYSEPALETIGVSHTEKRSFSRIARVCKNDRGLGKDHSSFFATLYKARIVCGNEKIPTSFYSQGVGGFAIYLDDLGERI